MNAGQDLGSIRSPSALQVISAVPPPSNPTALPLEGRPVVRSPEQLRLHRALEELGWAGVINEFNDAARLKDQSAPEPILITRSGIILSGIGSWCVALLDGRHEISCIEYDVSDEESLHCILALQRSQFRWNSFVLIRLALTLEPYFQQKAVENMSTGGKCKGLTNLSNADHIDVRREVANTAGSGTGNVDKVKVILQRAHPNIIRALQNGSLRIHRAWKWCRLPKSEQKEVFADHEEEQTRRKIVRELKTVDSKAPLDSLQVLEALRSFETSHSGQITFSITMKRETVVILGQDLINEIKITEFANGRD